MLSVEYIMIELETLAELLDGRLNDTTRDQVIEQLAANDEAYEAFTESVAVISDLDTAIRTAVGVIRIDLSM